jgi:ribosomal-protein-alanine N-acetyltransferase
MIRPAEPDEYPALRTIQERALDEQWPELLELAVDGPPLALVAETDRPVGYALAVPGEDAAYLAELAVAPEEQGQGHGSALLAALFDRLRSDGVDTLRLTARADDERVRAFYEQFGFEIVDSASAHYEDGGDAVVLAKSLC